MRLAVAEFQCLQGQLLVSLGQQDEGYIVLEGGIGRLDVRAVPGMC